MAGANSADEPLESRDGAVGEHATAAFELLGDETRVAILLALWEAFDPFASGTWNPTDGNAVPFSDLYDRVEYDTTANFSYHLEKLEGRFIRKSDDGYELLPAGHTIVRTIIGVAASGAETFEPAEIDLPCPLCGDSTAVTYRNQRLYRVCTGCDGYYSVDDEHPSGLLTSALANPAGLRNRTPEAIFAAIRTQIYHQYALRVAGICPECSGRIETRFHVCDAHDPKADDPCPTCGRQYDPAVRFVCTVCKHWNSTSVAEISMRHPAVAAFCWEHGIELGYASDDTARWLANLFEKVDQELLSRDPPRVRVTVRYEGDELRLTVDEEMNVVEVSE